MKPWHQIAWWRLCNWRQRREAQYDAVVFLRDIVDERRHLPEWLSQRATAVLRKMGEYKP